MRFWSSSTSQATILFFLDLASGILLVDQVWRLPHSQLCHSAHSVSGSVHHFDRHVLQRPCLAYRDSVFIDFHVAILFFSNAECLFRKVCFALSVLHCLLNRFGLAESRFL